MTARRKTDRHRYNAQRISTMVRTVLTVIAVVIFAAFYLIGYDLPFVDNPQFTAPLFTDAVIWLIYILFGATLVATAVSVGSTVKTRSYSSMTSTGVPSVRIAVATVVLLVVTLALSFAFGSTEPLPVNGHTFSSSLWLRIADMFIVTSAVLIAVAVAAVAFGMSGLNRKLNGRRMKSEPSTKS
ncbi:MAG: hypothetical protein K2G86_00480 [Prevotella sp.]|nr:hypothetical protein [Prevotella sp.]MDE6354978.1 hypothetical protein [Prevotella sp.]